MDSLKLTVGSAIPLEVCVIDENEQPENVNDVSRAVFTMRDSVSATTAILQLDTDAGDLSLAQLAAGKLIGNITQVQADALVPGVYIAECNLFFTTTAAWQPTERFRVEVEPATAPQLP